MADIDDTARQNSCKVAAAPPRHKKNSCQWKMITIRSAKHFVYLEYQFMNAYCTLHLFSVCGQLSRLFD